MLPQHVMLKYIPAVLSITNSENANNKRLEEWGRRPVWIPTARCLLQEWCCEEDEEYAKPVGKSARL
jgi:hypothetical protein